MFQAKGLRVGRYTSPHLIDFRERILVNGEPISESAVLTFLERTTPLAEKIGATFFELTTALAFAHFEAAHADVAVIETGLGGRLDSTNVITPVTATVTSIGLDHTDLLGDTIELIAKEKAGIFKPDVPAIVGDTNPETISILRASAAAVGAAPIRVVAHELQLSRVTVSSAGTSFVLETKMGLRALRTNLVGAHQSQNAAVAIATVRAATRGLEPEWDEIERGLVNARLPGRFQMQGRYIFDVAHNPAAARTLTQTLNAVAPQRPMNAVIAVLSDKDWRGVLREIGPLVDRVIITHAPSAPPERQWDIDAAMAYCGEIGVNCVCEAELDDALRLARDGAATVLVTGSFHTVGDSMSRLQVSPFVP
ncbi:MAG: bifunctional folylpolyglutamate synthase/dihydrofolate synthase [Gemmatimonadaceae bacterium]|nr:bifunctional folylpolyglutamate synthase/dihydrofolate synthase [Gemmatimonadaceae bacterium]